jgi:hypothetical protein
MADCNRVTPFGAIEAIDQRGLYLGNRGSIHRERSIVRPWQVRRWITCDLEHKGWVAPKWEPGRWTPLFFWDEAVALAAGHRPCALCRHPDFVRWMDAWEHATSDRPTVDPMDRQLHDDRVTGRVQLRHRQAWRDLPDGAFAVADGVAALVLSDRLVPWRPQVDGYGPPVARPRTGSADVLTPAATVAVLRHGYVAVVHPTALA